MGSDSGDDRQGLLGQIGKIVYAAFVHILFGCLVLGGILAIYAIVRPSSPTGIPIPDAIIIGIMGFLMLAIGLGFFYFAYFGAPRFLEWLEQDREKHRQRPWLANRQWRARRVVHSTKSAVWFMWFWCTALWAILGFFMYINGPMILAELRGPWSTAIPTAIPFLAGLIGLAVALSLTWHRLRFGDATLLIDTLPGYLGERFLGKVRARLPGRPREPIGITLVCGSVTIREYAGSGGTRSRLVTDELWSHRHELHPTQTIFGHGIVTLPIDIELPTGLPPTGHVLDDPQIVWRLIVTPISPHDQPVASTYEVPVFDREQSQ